MNISPLNILRYLKCRTKILLSKGKSDGFHKMELAYKYCPGEGLEIGGSAHNTFGLNTKNVDLFVESVWKDEEKELAGSVLPVDIVAPASNIPVDDTSQDFVISSHLLEHVPNVIKTLLEWDRIVKPGGVIFMIVPHKERTFDKAQERTPLSHIIDDFERNVIEITPDQEAYGHHHVWITEDVVEIIEYMISKGLIDWRVEEVEDVDSKVGNGFTIVCRKVDSLAEDTHYDLTAIIVNWNTREDLLKCLKSLKLVEDQSKLSVQTIVVDNASSDGSAAAVEADFPNVHLLRNNKNHGLAFAWNQGLLTARGKYVALLNPDIEVYPDCLDLLAEYLDQNPELGAVGPQLIDHDYKAHNYGLYVNLPSVAQFVLFRTPLRRLSERNPKLRKKYMGEMDPNLTQEVDQPPGAFIVVRRSVLEQIGGADDSFFLYYEDVDLAKRIKDAGWRIYYVAEAKARHKGGGSTDLVVIEKRRLLFYRSACRYFDKHHGLLIGLLIMFVSQGNYLWICLRTCYKRGAIANYARNAALLAFNWRY